MRRSRDSFANVKSEGRSSEISFCTVAGQMHLVNDGIFRERGLSYLLEGKDRHPPLLRRAWWEWDKSAEIRRSVSGKTASPQ